MPVFFTAGDSRDPELSGIYGAAKGSLFMLLVAMGLAFPLGVAAAIYLEEFAPQNNRSLISSRSIINNLAAVPSIVFGLARACSFHQFLWPAALGIAGRRAGTDADDAAHHHYRLAAAALKSVPPSIREAALGVWVPQKMQTVVPARAAAGHARNADGTHIGAGAGAGGDGAAADDRHGRFHRRGARRAARSGHRVAGADLSSGRTARSGPS